MNFSWLPWRWRSDVRAHAEVDRSQERLQEAQDLRREVDELHKRLVGHLRRNRFGALIDKQVFGGKG